MATEETTTIAVCAGSEASLHQVMQLLRAAGSWGVVPVQWPDANALINARKLASAFVLHSGDGFNATQGDLIDLLGARPLRTPLIVTGNEPAAAAKPNLWLPALPSPDLLAKILHQLLDGDVAEPEQIVNPGWRRKSDMIIGTSAPIAQLLHTLDRLAPSQTPVLIAGESGVGKELVARALHFCGPRAKEPFIAINCAAIPENLIEAELFGYQRGAFTGAVNAHVGAIEAADNGTLFLDEIGEMPLGMQAKLLRVLESSELQRIGSTETQRVNFRLVSATNRKLEQAIKLGRFREDLYYRVQVYPLDVPPLRDRLEDIPLLVTHHLSSISARDKRPTPRFTAGALEKLLTYHWPGNVRELVNTLERATLLAGDWVIDAEHIMLSSIPTDGDAEESLLPYKDAKTRFELDYYAQLMRIAGGNVSLAAKLGQKTRKEIYDALKRLGLDATAYRAATR